MYPAVLLEQMREINENYTKDEQIESKLLEDLKVNIEDELASRSTDRVAAFIENMSIFGMRGDNNE
mgnify:CR=1 FL=1